jgi:glutamate synthase (NADPH) small chain
VGKITGFLEYEREDRDYEPVDQRIRHWHEFVLPLPEQDYVIQAARCMNCGVPYCQGTGSLAPGSPGCPVNNQIPDWNDLVYAGNWDEAARNLHSTNNFPEVTGNRDRQECRDRRLRSGRACLRPAARASRP